MTTAMTSLGILAVLAWGAVSAFSDPSEKFDKAFEQFLRDNDYRGGSVSAMRQGRLLHARGYGQDRDGQTVTSHSHFPLSSLAKSLTAVAVMRLVQDGALELDDTVFSPSGVLSSLPAWNASTVDARLRDVTVSQLLRHAGGWGVTGPRDDPLLYPLYLAQGHKVPDIAKVMGVTSPLTPRDLIRYVMSQPLTFTPGSKVAYSNVGYLVLGRVIEEVTGGDYQDYVKKVILDPCGMWSTRLTPPTHHEAPHSDPRDPRDPHDRRDSDDLSVYDLLTPTQLDSALGWWSNVYDVSRFARCVFQQKRILDKRHLELLRAPLHSGSKQTSSWQCAGFMTDATGGVWQGSDSHTDDVLLFTNVSHHAQSRQGPVDTWVVLLYGASLSDVRPDVRELMGLLHTGRAPHAPRTPLFLYDLSDLHRHDLWEPWDHEGPHYCIRFQLDEHRLTAWVTAARDAGLRVTWVTSWVSGGHAHFLLVAREYRDHDFVFEHGLSHRALLKQKLHLEERGYNLTLLHSYVSSSHSHSHGGASYAALYRRDAYTQDTQMKYGTGHLPEPYEKLVQMYYEQHFHPLSQTVVQQGKDETFSFIFIKRASDKERTDFKHFYDLPAKKLSKLTMDNARANFRLSYLNSYNVGDKFKFSAIFSNATSARGVLEAEQSVPRATEISISNLRDGLAPRCIVPYLDDQGALKVTVYFEEEEEEPRYVD